MKYISTITTFIFLNIFAVICLYTFGNKSRLIEEQNKKIEIEILELNEKIKINEVEYNYHNNYVYLKKLKNIYFDNDINFQSKIIDLKNFKKNGLNDVYRTSSN